MYRRNSRWLRNPSDRVGTLALADLPPPSSAVDEETALIDALRSRDEEAFVDLVDRFYSPMIRLARTYVGTEAEAEEVVQDTWLGVLSRIDRFEGRSSLKTWIFRILVNRARSRGKREARIVPFSALLSGDDADGGQNPETQISASAPPGRWHGAGCDEQNPEEHLLSSELQEVIDAAIRKLPSQQQQVITLRDLEGWSPAEICSLLEISEANQRVLLHRARLRVREALGGYFASAEMGLTPMSGG